MLHLSGCFGSLMRNLVLLQNSTAANHPSCWLILSMFVFSIAPIVFLFDFKRGDETALLLAVQVEDGQDVIERELSFAWLWSSLINSHTVWHDELGSVLPSPYLDCIDWGRWSDNICRGCLFSTVIDGRFCPKSTMLVLGWFELLRVVIETAFIQVIL